MGKLITRLKGVSSSDLSASTNAYKKKISKEVAVANKLVSLYCMILYLSYNYS